MNGLFASYRLSELRSFLFWIFLSSLPCVLSLSVVIDFVSLESFSLRYLKEADKRPTPRNLRQNFTEYPIWHKSRKAAGTIFLEIHLHGCGPLYLCKEKGWTKRNELRMSGKGHTVTDADKRRRQEERPISSLRCLAQFYKRQNINIICYIINNI